MINDFFNIILNGYPLIIFAAYIIGEFLYLKANNAFNMNTRPLTEQRLFWSAIRIPLIAFLWFGIFAWKGTSLLMSSEGFDNFLNISKLPLACLSLSLPLGVIVNNIHRTIQTNKQIEETEKKNKNDIYYSHIKFIVDNLNAISLKEIKIEQPHGDYFFDLSFEKPFKLYKALFQKSSAIDNDFTISDNFITKSMHYWNELNNQLSICRDSKTELIDIAFAVNSIENTLEKIRKETHIKLNGMSTDFYATNEEFTIKTKLTNEKSIQKFISAHIEIFIELTDLLNIPIPDNSVIYSIKNFTTSKSDNLMDFSSLDFSVNQPRNLNSIFYAGPQNVHIGF